MRNPRCSACKGRLVRIAYGMPAPGLLEKSGRGLVELGGCTISDDGPGYSCSACRQYFRHDGSPYVGEIDPLNYRRNEKSAP